MRCWLCVVAAAAAASVAQKSEPRLLYPIMIMGGPNNQYQQFLESMLLAKALRRKIVLAPFLSWPGGGDRQRGSHRTRGGRREILDDRRRGSSRSSLKTGAHRRAAARGRSRERKQRDARAGHGSFASVKF